MRCRILLLSAIGACVGCSPRELALSVTGVGREYARPALDAWNASLDAAKSLQLCTWDAHHDALGGEFYAHRDDGTDFRIVVEAVDRFRSKVVMHVPIGDSRFADLIQERIAEKLGWAEARPDPSGANSLQGNYPEGVEECVRKARDTMAVGSSRPASGGSRRGANPIAARRPWPWR